MKERVVVAMSGGVDSSVAACLLKDAGYEVIGITMCFNLPDSLAKRPTCCGIQGIEDARCVAHKLGIRHYVLNFKKDLEKWVINDFLQEYLNGRTPNPCVRCNQYIKFDALLKKTYSLDAKFLATGHYACIEKNKNYLLKKSKDKTKDQSYFLYRLTQNQLRHIIFPLGNYTKTQVRKLAREFSLPVADKLASQEICFLPNMDYRRFLKHRLSQISKTQIIADLKPGPIVDKEGNVLGQHKGIAFYTIGQREGLGIAKGYPLYVTKIDHKNKQITVGKREDAYKREFLVKDVHFISEPINPVRNFALPFYRTGISNGVNPVRDRLPEVIDRHLRCFISNGVKKKVEVKVRIRYNHTEAVAKVIPLGNQIKVSFRRPQFAITPGQSAVFYDKDEVLGGGIIQEVLD